MAPCPPFFVRGPVMSTKKDQNMTVKQYQYTPGNHKEHELFFLTLTKIYYKCLIYIIYMTNIFGSKKSTRR